MSVVFTRYGKGSTGRSDTPQQPERVDVVGPVKPLNVGNVIAAQPKTIADFIKTYGKAEWEKFRATILATPATVAYLQASTDYAKQATGNLLLRTEIEIQERIVKKWQEQLAIQQKAIQDGIGFVAEKWSDLDTATQKFLSSFSGAFVGTKEQADEQFKGGTVYWAPKKLAKSCQNAQSPAGPIPVGEMNDPVGKIAFPDTAKFWLTSSSTDLSKAVGGTLTAKWPMQGGQTRQFLEWAAKQTSVLFRKDVADRWFDCGMVSALAAFGDAVQQRVNLINATWNLPQAIEQSKANLKNTLQPQLTSSDQAVVNAQNATLEALKKISSGVPAECATATAAVNFELAMAAALLQATAKLNEAVKAGLTKTGDIIAQMESLQANLSNAKTKAEKELIAAKIMALAGQGAADLSRVNSRLGDRKGKIGASGDRGQKAIAIAEAHGLDAYAVRQAAKILDDQSKMAEELNTAHAKTAEAEGVEIVKIVKEVEKDAGSGGQDAADLITTTIAGSGGDTSKSGSGAFWLIAAAAAAKFFM
jgi:hypothetical protein